MSRAGGTPPARPPVSGAGVALSGLAALAAGVGVWTLWWRLGFPAGAFATGLEGHGPDPLAWPRLLAVWAPAGHLLYTGAQAWLARADGRRAGRRPFVADQLAALALALGLGAALLGLRGHAAWRLGLGAWYVAFVGVRTAILLRALWSWLAAAAPAPPRATAAVFVGALVPYLLLGAHLTTTTSATGDEPYYLLVAHSLLHDRDLDLSNNFARRDYLPFYWGHLDASARGVRSTPDGRTYAASFQGLQPALLLPGYWLAGRTGAVATVNLAGALALALTFRLALLSGASRRAAFLAWLGAAFSVPVLSFAASPWPEMTGALLATLAAYLLLRTPRTPAALGTAALVLAVAVAVKTRLFLVALAIMAGFPRRASWRAAGALAALAAAAFVAMAAYDAAALGGQVARRLHALGVAGTLGWLLGWAVQAPTQYRGHLGLLLDQEFGVVLTAPVFALALAGAAAAARQGRWRLVALAAGPFVLAWYLLGGVAVSRTLGLADWAGGFSPPGRFVAAALPLLAVLGAVTLDRLRGRAAWTLVAGLYAVSLGHAAILSLRPAWRFQHGTGRAVGLVELFRVTGIDAGRLLPSYVAPGTAGVAIGAVVMAAIAAAGWAVARRPGGPPPRGAWIAGSAGAALLALSGLLLPWLSAAGPYPAVLGSGRGGVTFHGRIPVDTGPGPALRERLVWAAQRPAVLELAPRAPRGTYRVVVTAAAQGPPGAVALRIRAGSAVETSTLLDASAPPAWRERDYVAEVVWPGGRLPIRLELTGISRAEPVRFAYLRRVELREGGAPLQQSALRPPWPGRGTATRGVFRAAGPAARR